MNDATVKRSDEFYVIYENERSVLYIKLKEKQIKNQL